MFENLEIFIFLRNSCYFNHSDRQQIMFINATNLKNAVKTYPDFIEQTNCIIRTTSRVSFEIEVC